MATTTVRNINNRNQCLYRAPTPQPILWVNWPLTCVTPVLQVGLYTCGRRRAVWARGDRGLPVRLRGEAEGGPSPEDDSETVGLLRPVTDAHAALRRIRLLTMDLPGSAVTPRTKKEKTQRTTNLTSVGTYHVEVMSVTYVTRERKLRLVVIIYTKWKPAFFFLGWRHDFGLTQAVIYLQNWEGYGIRCCVGLSILGVRLYRRGSRLLSRKNVKILNW